MGRLPSTYAGRQITDRNPYTMYGSISMLPSTSSQYPDATFANNADKPFEIHRIIPRVYGQDAGQLPVSPQAAQELLASLVRLRIVNILLNYEMTKTPAAIDSMVKGSSERTWEFADPHYLVTSGQLQISLDVAAFPVSGAEPFTELEISRLKIDLQLQGFFITIEPPR